MSVNTEIRDSLAAHDIDLQRVSGGLRRRIEDRIDELGKDLRALVTRVDAHGAQRRGARDRRLVRLRKSAKELIDEAYAEINRWMNSDLKRVAKAESKAVIQIVGDELP